jgi:hypothetical protein
MVLFHRGSVALALACSVAFAWVLVPLSAGATVAASIDASRTSGAAPLGVVFHGQRSTTHSSLSAEERWQQLDYEWDFSDCFPFETWSTTGASKAKSYGPITARVFTDIGTCDVVLTVSEDGSTSDTDTIAITVNDPDTTWSGSDTLCVDADATPTPGSDGCPSGADAEENDDFDDAVNSNIGSYGRILFRNDETYSCASTASLSAGTDGLIGTYGDGARALLDCSFSNATPVVTAYGGGHDDYRFTGFRLQGGGGDASIVHAEADGSHVVGLLVHDIFIESGFDEELVGWRGSRGSPPQRRRGAK